VVIVLGYARLNGLTMVVDEGPKGVLAREYKEEIVTLTDHVTEHEGCVFGVSAEPVLSPWYPIKSTS
jgi:hypothetical protein